MAESNKIEKQQGKSQATKSQICRYFLQGSCSRGSSCNYSHEKSASGEKVVCQFHLAGNCWHGENCRFEHVRKKAGKKSESQPQKMPASTHLKPQVKSNGDIRQSHMVTLTKNGLDSSVSDGLSTDKPTFVSQKVPRSWADAKPFVPGQKCHKSVPGSYAAATATGLAEAQPLPNMSAWQQDEEIIDGAWGGVYAHDNDLDPEPIGIGGLPLSAITADTPLCPYYAKGECPYHDKCSYAHGDLCDLCGLPQLHPVNREQQEKHIKECMADHEKEMELAFALQASEGQECGICLENVLTKESGPGVSADRRFGILENCNHCFCLTCIRQWRGNKELAIETHRTCPTCRTHSDFITPSKYWVTSPEEKTKLIQEYKKALAAKPCQYFKKGKGECPFNTKCFYLHALPDGTVARENLVKRRWRTNAEGEFAAQDDELSLWDFINSRDEGAGASWSVDEELSQLLLEIFQASDDDDDFLDNGWYEDSD